MDETSLSPKCEVGRRLDRCRRLARFQQRILSFDELSVCYHRKRDLTEENEQPSTKRIKGCFKKSHEGLHDTTRPSTAPPSCELNTDHLYIDHRFNDSFMRFEPPGPTCSYREPVQYVDTVRSHKVRMSTRPLYANWMEENLTAGPTCSYREPVQYVNTVRRRQVLPSVRSLYENWMYYPWEENLTAGPTCSYREPVQYVDTVRSHKASRETTHESIYKARRFQRFHYLYNLTRMCSSRVKLVQRSMVEKSKLPKKVMVKIRYIGVNESNKRHMIHCKEERKQKKKCKEERKQKQKRIWEVSPLICFQNDLSLQSAKELLHAEKARHKILVTRRNNNPQTIIDGTIVSVGPDHLEEAIASCLEEPLFGLLKKWKMELQTWSPTKHTLRIISEIDGICKQMSPEENNEAKLFDCSCSVQTSIVPDDVKDYLFSNPNVNSFGIWENSQFKVFVNYKTDENNLQLELIQINRNFFTKYRLKIEKRKVVEKLSMTQGDCILSRPQNDCETFYEGTMGAFVTKPNDHVKKYGLTCSHIFPRENITAYQDDPKEPREIGNCVFSTSEMHCDFAVIEMNDSVSDKCDVIFRRDDNKKTNARVYDGTIDRLSMVHKIGAKSGVTNGTILSAEFYVKNLTDKDSKDSIFFVRGTDGHFSVQGDSGSLVFSRTKEAKQNYVNVVGMVYGNNVIVDDIHECEESSKEEKSDIYGATRSTETEKKCYPKSSGNAGSSSQKEEMQQFDVDPEHISSCFRIHPALDLFKMKKGVPVKFKDDLSPASSPSSSDDSNSS